MSKCHECGSTLEVLPEDGDMYCPRCEPSRIFGAVLDDDIPVDLDEECQADE
jgi:uncharacterized Zn finger protein (UPF0148 family)